MQKGLSVYIPQPCHEDWDKMNPAEKGRFCNACAKQVVDFTAMSDQQVLDYFSKSTAKVCGRFAGDQLQRTLQPLVIEKKKTWWIAALMPLLLLFDKADAQKNKTVTNIVDTIKKPPNNEMLVGKVAFEPVRQSTIEGKIIGNDGNAVPYATITLKEQFINVSADSIGAFSIQVPGKFDSVALIISAKGYETKTVLIKLQDENFVTVTLEQEVILVGEITSYVQPAIMGGATMGLCIPQKIRSIDTIPSLIRKVFNNAAFKVFPNPVAPGTDISIELKNKGVFTIQLLDSHSKILAMREIVTNGENSLVSLSIPSFLSAGSYYILAIDERRKKQYTNKIVIQ